MRGFRFRVFLLVVLVAVLAMGVAGGLVAWRVDQAAQATVETQQSNTDDIAGSLEKFAAKRASWSRIDVKTDELHDATGERILLTTLSGETVFDSAGADGRTKPPSAQQPTLLRPRVAPPGDMGDEVASQPDPAAAFKADPKDALKELIELRGEQRMARCQDNFTDEIPEEAWKPGMQPHPECEDSDKLTDSEIREDREAVYGCYDSSLARPDKSVCQYYAIQQRSLDITPEPLLLRLGTEEPFQITYPATQLTILGLVVLAVVVLASALLARRVIRPIDALISASRSLSSGDLNAKVTIRGHDELTELGETFNGMVDSLNRAERQRRQLIADSAHELRTPLSNIHGYLEAIADGVVPASPDYIDSLREESALLARIIDDLRLLALSDAGQLPCQPVPTDAADLLSTCRTAHQAAAHSSRIGLRLDVPDDTGLLIDVDPDRMRQAIGNLITNALHVTPADGTVTLRAFASGDEIVIGVADTGGGIAPEHLPRVFDRFWRADSSRSRDTGGSGLGLAITRELVVTNGGTITAGNHTRGAVFTITFPRLANHPRPVPDT